MGNTVCVDRHRRRYGADALLSPVVPPSRRFSARFVGYGGNSAPVSNRVNGQVAYEFHIVPPLELPSAGGGTPGQVISRTFEEFQELASVIGQRHRARAPVLPPSTFFEHKDPVFLATRAAGLEAYLNQALSLEPLPGTRALRDFLGICQPLGAGPLAWSRLYGGAALAGEGGVGPLVAVGRRVPVGVVANILAFMEPLWVLRVSSAVCRSMHAASRDPGCWPTLHLRTCRAERWLDGFYTLLVPTCGHLQALELDIAFECPRLSVALPGGLMFNMLERLIIRVGDRESVKLAAELLECVESPRLRTLHLRGPALDSTVLSALAECAGRAPGAVERVKVCWEDSQAALRLEEGVSLSLQRLLDTAPSLQELSIAFCPVPSELGLPRLLLPLGPPWVEIPGTQPLLADMVRLANLQELTFDFMSDDVLARFRAIADGSLMLRRASFSGVISAIQDPLDALVTLLTRLGEGLEHFSMYIDDAAHTRDLMAGWMRPRIGPLPNIWLGRATLRSLEINWMAFDDDGVRCIVDNCPQLQALLLDRSEYWTDHVADIVVQGLPELQRFRLRTSTLMSDRCLYTLAEAAPRYALLEIEPSFSMSHYGLQYLEQRLAAGRGSVQNGGFDAQFGTGVMGLLHAAADLADPTGALAHRRAGAMAGEAEAVAAGGGGALVYLEPLSAARASAPAYPARRSLDVGR